MRRLGAGTRRRQICSSAAFIIAEEGFAGTTMRRVADQAGVSTGMINHYFANRGEMLRETLIYVSEEMQARAAAAIRGETPGEERMRAFLHAVLPNEPEVEQAWRIWIASFAEAVRSESLRATIDQRLGHWYSIIERAMEGYHPPEYGVPPAWEFDAMLNGLVLQYLTADSGLTLAHLEEAMLAFIRGNGAREISSGGRHAVQDGA